MAKLKNSKVQRKQARLKHCRPVCSHSRPRALYQTIQIHTPWANFNPGPQPYYTQPTLSTQPATPAPVPLSAALPEFPTFDFNTLDVLGGSDPEHIAKKDIDSWDSDCSTWGGISDCSKCDKQQLYSTLEQASNVHPPTLAVDDERLLRENFDHMNEATVSTEDTSIMAPERDLSNYHETLIAKKPTLDKVSYDEIHIRGIVKQGDNILKFDSSGNTPPATIAPELPFSTEEPFFILGYLQVGDKFIKFGGDSERDPVYTERSVVRVRDQLSAAFKDSMWIE